MLVEILIGILAILILINWLVQKNFEFWEKRGITTYREYNKYREIIATFLSLYSMPQQAIQQYNGLPEKSVYGIYSFNIPMLMIKDPEMLRQIMIKDFDHFTDHVDSFFKNDTDPYFSKNLFALKGKRWHSMRTTLSPAFTGSKMRNMFILMRDCGEQIVEYFMEKCTGTNGQKRVVTVNLLDSATRFTNDVIATVAFGIKIDSLKDPNNTIFKMGQQAQNFKIWRMTIIMLLPTIAKLFDLKFLPNWVYKHFGNMIRETIRTRERDHIVRPDMIHLLTEARKEQLSNGGVIIKDDDEAEINGKASKTTNDKYILTEDDIISQAFIFFIAGFTNVALFMCWTAYELTVNPDVQEKLFDEVQQTMEKCKGKLTYDSLIQMKYLDMVVSETLRKWPPLPMNNRQVTKPYTLKTDDGEIKMEPGWYVGIPVIGLHHDPKYFPNPDKFDPERFRDPSKIHPFTYQPFGAGPRICIGNRLTLLEVKVFLVYLLSKFEFVPVDKTPKKPVLKNGPNMELKDGFWIGLKCRN